MRRMQKILLSFFVGDDLAIFLVQESDVMLPTQVSDLGWGRCSVSGSLVVSRTALHESIIVHTRGF